MDPLDEKVDGGGGDLFTTRVDGRERGDRELALVDVVEADHRDVVRHPPTGLLQAPQDAEGERVVEREHGVEGAPFVDHLVHGGSTAGSGSWTVFQWQGQGSNLRSYTAAGLQSASIGRSDNLPGVVGPGLAGRQRSETIAQRTPRVRIAGATLREQETAWLTRRSTS